MSQKSMDSLIKEFLKQVKNKLPNWLKDKKKEVKDIIAELEEHLWEKAGELSDIDRPTEDSVRLAIAHMGTPESIAKEYKRRGTPKVYITEELWPLYIKVLKIIFLVIIAISIVSIVLNMLTGNILEILSIANLLPYFAVFTIVTIIFVVLSMEGYFPEDFKSEKEVSRKKLELEKAQELGLPISPKTGKPLKPFIHPTGEIIGGIVQIIIGLFLMMLPIPGLFDLMHPEFQFVLRVFGLLLLTEGGLDLSRGMIGNYKVPVHQVIHLITIGVKLASIPLVVFLWMHPEIFPFFNWDESSNTLVYIGVSEEFYDLIRMVMVVVIIVTILVPIEDVYKIIKLEKYKI